MVAETISWDPFVASGRGSSGPGACHHYPTQYGHAGILYRLRDWTG